MAVTHRIYTYEDLATTPDDGNRYEIIGGELIVSPAPILAHQDVVGVLYMLLRLFVSTNRLGRVYTAPIDVRLSPHNTVQPDIVFISQARLNILRRAFVDGAPDLVIEVLSDRTRAIDLVRKRALYAMAGVAEYWIADLTDRTLMVLTLVDGDYVVVEQRDGVAGSLVVPGFEVAVVDVFAPVTGEA